MSQALPVVAVLQGNSAAAPSEIGRAAEGLCSLIFVPLGELDAIRSNVLMAFGELVTAGAAVSEITQALRPKRLAGVTTFSEDALEACALVAEELRLPGNPSEATASTVDKRTQRARLHAAAVDDTRYLAVAAGSLLDPAMVRSFGLPAVVKPARGTGSRATFVLTGDGPTDATVLRIVNDALRVEPFIVESLLEGPREPHSDWADYVSVEMVMDGSRAYAAAITGKVPLAAPFREQGGAVPAALPTGLRADVQTLAVRACAALGLTSGLAHVEIKLTPAGPRVIEVNPRLGGLQEDLVHRAYGVSLIRLGLRASLGHDLGDLLMERAEVGVAWWYAPASPSGRVEVASVRGLDKIRALPDVASARLGAGPGSVLHSEHGWGDFIVLVKGHSIDHDAAVQVRRRIDALLEVDYVD